MSEINDVEYGGTTLTPARIDPEQLVRRTQTTLEENPNDDITFDRAQNGFKVTVFKDGQITVTNQKAKPGELESVDAFTDGKRTGYVKTEQGIEFAPDHTDLTRLQHGGFVATVDPKALDVKIVNPAGKTILHIDETIEKITHKDLDRLLKDFQKPELDSGERGHTAPTTQPSQIKKSTGGRPI